MKSLPIAALAAMTLVVTSAAIDGAYAQDVGSPVLAGAETNASATPARAHRWGGYYDEAFIGGHIANARERFPSAGTSTGDFSVAGVTGGLGFGYGWQFGRVVVGAEGDFAGNSSDGAAHAPNSTYNYEMENNWLGTAQGRVGYDFGINILPYVTAGLAFGDVRVHNYRPDGAGSHTDFTKTNLGWVAGAGVETPLNNSRWALKIEYRHVDLGRVEGTGSAGATVNANFSDNIFRLCLVHRSL